MTNWLIRTEELQAARAIDRFEPSAEQLRSAEASFADMPPVFSTAGRVMQINVSGVLTESPCLWCRLFGSNTTAYSEIREAIGVALSSDEIKEVVFTINSPGGQVAGLFETLADIEKLRGAKKVRVEASLAASAAYAIAASAGPITANSKAAEFGSVGVVTTYYVDPQFVDITSTNAPKKRPDVMTEEGKAMVREELDALHDLLVDSIQRGRGVSRKDVDANFGQGGVLLATAAAAAGMIDRVAKAGSLNIKPTPAHSGEATQDNAPSAEIHTPVFFHVDAQTQTNTEGQPSAQDTKTQTSSEGAAKGKPKMDLNEFRAQHPELFAVVLEQGKEAGRNQERDRVSAHLVYGESGDMATAVASVRSGAEVTQELTARYQLAASAKLSQTNRDADAGVVTSATSGAVASAVVEATAEAAAGDGKPDEGDQIVALLDSKSGDVS